MLVAAPSSSTYKFIYGQDCIEIPADIVKQRCSNVPSSRKIVLNNLSQQSVLHLLSYLQSGELVYEGLTYRDLGCLLALCKNLGVNELISDILFTFALQYEEVNSLLILSCIWEVGLWKEFLKVRFNSCIASHQARIMDNLANVSSVDLLIELLQSNEADLSEGVVTNCMQLEKWMERNNLSYENFERLMNCTDKIEIPSDPLRCGNLRSPYWERFVKNRTIQARSSQTSPPQPQVSHLYPKTETMSSRPILPRTQACQSLPQHLFDREAERLTSMRHQQPENPMPNRSPTVEPYYQTQRRDSYPMSTTHNASLDLAMASTKKSNPLPLKRDRAKVAVRGFLVNVKNKLPFRR